MTHRKISFWILIGLGLLGIISSIYLFLNGENFGTYFLAGFSGIAVITSLLINKNVKNAK